MPKVMIEMEMPKNCIYCELNSYDKVSKRYICLPIDCTLTDEEFYAETRPSWCPLQEVKECMWHKKTERPEKKLHCTRLIVTKFGSVFDEKEIDNGAVIETDWAYLDDLIECTKGKE